MIRVLAAVWRLMRIWCWFRGGHSWHRYQRREPRDAGGVELVERRACGWCAADGEEVRDP